MNMNNVEEFELNNFYRLTNNDIKNATEVYARAYSKITLYEKALEDVEEKFLVLKTFFEVAIRYGLKYGFPLCSFRKIRRNRNLDTI